MLIAAVVFTILKWLGLLVAAGFAIWLRAGGVTWKPFAGIAGALFVTFAFSAMSTEVTVVKGGGEVARYRLFGSSDYQFADGHHAPLAHDGDSGIVVNDTAMTLTIKSVYYGSLRLPSSPHRIEPASVDNKAPSHLEHIGPNDRPPSSVSVPKGSSFEIRDWLTWG